MESRFCPSRRAGRSCTWPLGHPGLHRYQGAMWSDAGADPIHCAGSGERGEPAQALADGWPDGRAACPRCQRFVVLDAEGRLAEHGTTDPDEPDDEIAHRRAWFNANGW